MKAIKKYLVASFATLAILATSLAGIFFNAPVKTAAEDSDFTKIVLSEELAKIGYTAEELTASGWDGSSRDANKKALFNTAFNKSTLKFYAGAHTGGTYYQVNLYQDWANHSNSWKWSGTKIGGLCVGNNYYSDVDTETFASSGKHYISHSRGAGTTEYGQFYSIAYVATADGVVTIPESVLTIDSFVKDATLRMAFTKGSYKKAIDDGWTEYTTTGDITIPKQVYEVASGDVIYINFSVGGAEMQRGVHISYDPIWYFGAEEYVESQGVQKTLVMDFEKDSDASLIVSNADDRWVWQQAISSEQAHGGSRSYKISPREAGDWPNVVFGSKGADYHDLTKIESISVWVYFDSAVSESVSNLGIKICNHDESSKEIQEKKYERTYTIPSKTWTQITVNVADINNQNIDLTKAYVKFAQLGKYEDRSQFYLDDFVVTYYELEEEVDYNQTFTFAEAVGAISYTDEELAATGMTLAAGVLGGATSNLSAENLAKKETFYKTAYGRSPLKYYVAYKDAYKAKEYWQWAVDKDNSWKFSYAHIGGLSAGHTGTTDSRINAGANHRFYSSETYSYVYSFVYVAPVTGTLTISAHTLGTSAAIRVGYAKAEGEKTTLLPSDATLNFINYAAGEGANAHSVPEQTFELKAGERVYVSFDVGAGSWIYYNPTFTFVPDQCALEGHDEIVHEAKEATCEEAGWDEYVTCSRCDYSTKVEIPALSQTYVKGARLAYVTFNDMILAIGGGKGSAATLADANGNALVTYNFKHGSVENGMSIFDTYSYNYVGDSNGSGVVRSAIWKTYVANYDAFIYEIVAKKDVYVDIQAQLSADIDGAMGATNGWFATTEFRVYVKDVEGNLIKIKTFNGVDKDDPESVTVKDIYLAKGETLYYEFASIGPDERNMTYPPYLNVFAAEKGEVLGHTKGAEIKENVVEATCTEAGHYESVYKCIFCDMEMARTNVTVDALGHSEEAVKENVVEATCTEAGHYDSVVYCATCGVELSRTNVTVDALGHDEVIDAAVAPTCVATGLTEGKHCGRCNEVLVPQNVVDMVEHTYGEWEIVTPTDGPNDGLQKKVCSVCGDTVEEVIPHDIDWDLVTAEDCSSSIGGSTVMLAGLAMAVVAIFKKKRA